MNNPEMRIFGGIVLAVVTIGCAPTEAYLRAYEPSQDFHGQYGNATTAEWKCYDLMASEIANESTKVRGRRRIATGIIAGLGALSSATLAFITTFLPPTASDQSLAIGASITGLLGGGSAIVELFSSAFEKDISVIYKEAEAVGDAARAATDLPTPKEVKSPPTALAPQELGSLKRRIGEEYPQIRNTWIPSCTKKLTAK